MHYENKRVQNFDASGGFILAWSMESASSTPEGIAIDAGGRIYVTDYDRGRLEVRNSEGELIVGWDGGSSAGSGARLRLHSTLWEAST